MGVALKGLQHGGVINRVLKGSKQKSPKECLDEEDP